MIETIPLVDGIEMRQLESADAPLLTAAFVANREHLAPWDPLRDDGFFTIGRQQALVDASIVADDKGESLSLVLIDSYRLVGRVNLSGIMRGPFQSCNLGYWIDHRYTGRGLITVAVAKVIELARDDLALHRLQAGTLRHNHASQRVLMKSGFSHIGLAPNYLQIAGMWQDHELFQLILHD